MIVALYVVRVKDDRAVPANVCISLRGARSTVGGLPRRLSGVETRRGREQYMPGSIERAQPIKGHVVIVAEHASDGRQLAELFRQKGMQPGRDRGLLVVAARNILARELSRINRLQLRRGRPWMLVKTAGERTWIGPLFLPGKTGCWACLAHRLLENGWTDSAGGACEPAILKRAVDEAGRWLGGQSDRIAGHILVFPVGEKEPERHVLIRRPQCPECGGWRARQQQPIRLHRSPKVSPGTRTCSVEATLDRLSRHESELTGIVARVTRVASWSAFPIFFAYHCRPLSSDAPSAPLRRALQPVAGKGATVVEAHASCLAEAIERYSIQWQGNEYRRFSQRTSLGPNAIGIRELALLTSRQVRERKRWNREAGGFSYIPAVPENNAGMDWTAVWSLTEQRRKFVPTAYCYLYYPGWIYPADSNGCAAGNIMEEAILHGFLELVERDAVAIWWYNRLRRPPVAIDGPVRKRFQKACKELARKGRTLAVLDLTTDFEIPVFAAVSALEDGRRIFIGTGAHLQADIALSRAIAELCQVVDAHGEGLPIRHGRLSTVEQALRRWLRQARLKDLPYLVPYGEGASLGQFPNWSAPDVKKDVEWCVAKARRLGLEVLVLDMTRPDLDFPVVRVIVPGMRHCWGRFAPGRLYEVPVKMGWRKTTLSQSELNPIPYFL